MEIPWYWSALGVVSTMACGSGEATPASVDAPAACEPVSGPTGVITVNVHTALGVEGTVGLPFEGAAVYFVERDCRAVMVTSDADGVAVSPEVHEGTTVVVVQQAESVQGAMAIFLDLSPGMTVTAGPDVPEPPLTTQVGEFQVDAPAQPGADLYTLSIPCTSVGNNGTAAHSWRVITNDPCDRTDRVFVAMALDSSVGVIAYSTTRADMTPGNDVTLPAFEPLVDFTASVTGTPAEVTSVTVHGAYFDASAPMARFEAQASPAGGAVDLVIPTTPVGDRLSVATYFETPSFTGSAPVLVRSLDESATAETFDGADMLPFLASSTWDPTTRVIDWDESIGTGAGDLAIAQFTIYTAADGPMGLRIFAPHSGSRIELPPLPDEVVASLPPASDFGPEIYLVDDLAAADYAAVVPTADADSRMTFYTGPRFGTSAAVWLTLPAQF